MATIITIEVFTIKMRDDGIVHMHVQGDQLIDMRLYKLLIEGIGEVSGGKKVPILSTADEEVLPDDDVKEYFTKPDSNPYSLANALIAPSLPQKLIGNLLLRLNKRGTPMKLFRNNDEAIAWLKTFL
jgi:hypothetical protein